MNVEHNKNLKFSCEASFPNFKELLGRDRYFEIQDIAEADLEKAGSTWVLAFSDELIVIRGTILASYHRRSIKSLELERLRSFCVFRVHFNNEGEEFALKVSHRNSKSFDDLILIWAHGDCIQRKRVIFFRRMAKKSLVLRSVFLNRFTKRSIKSIN